MGLLCDYGAFADRVNVSNTVILLTKVAFVFNFFGQERHQRNLHKIVALIMGAWKLKMGAGIPLPPEVSSRHHCVKLI
jgi:hypothetical protein